MATKAQRDPSQVQELTQLIASGGSTTIYPTDESIVSLLHARFRHDLPYTRLSASSSTLVVVNPYKTLANTNDASAREYKSRCWDDLNAASDGHHSGSGLQPHPYELAARVYAVARRKHESQALLFRGITGSGKSFTRHLVLTQLLNLAAPKRSKVASQILAFQTLLHSFGHSKTPSTPSASRYTQYLELHLNDQGHLAAAKILAFGLDKSRVGRLKIEERSFHVFYQLLAGATIDEREGLNLEDAADYAMLASSGCFRLPGGGAGLAGGLFGGDDALSMEELRDAFKTLGFKPKSVWGIWTVLTAILTLGNVRFMDGNGGGAHAGGLRKDEEDGNAVVANPATLERAAKLLGISSEHVPELEALLTRRSDYVRKEVVTRVLDVRGAEQQRDKFLRDLYALLFAFLVESANRRVTEGLEPQNRQGWSQIVLVDHPGYQSKSVASTGSISSGPGPLLSSALGSNGFDEFVANYQDELVHSFVIRHIFEDSIGRNSRIVGDGVQLPNVNTMDNAACIELLRGSLIDPKTSAKKPAGVLGMMGKAARDLRHGKVTNGLDEELVREMRKTFGSHASFVSNPLSGLSGLSSPFTSPQNSTTHMFGINHWAGNVAYDAKDFVEKDCDSLDAGFVQLLRSKSEESFVSKLVSGPGICTESHQKDPNILVRAQVSVRPLRSPTSVDGGDEESGLDKDKAYAVTAQVDSTFASLLGRLERHQFGLWNVACLKPNDSGSPNSFDKKRVRAQVRALGLVDMVVKRGSAGGDWVCDWSIDEFREKTGADDVSEWAREVGWGEGIHYALGKRRVWVSWDAWKDLEDRIRASEGDVDRPAPDEEGSIFAGAPAIDDGTVEDWGTSRKSFAYGTTQSVTTHEAQDPFLYGNGGAMTPATNAGFNTPRHDQPWGGFDKSSPMDYETPPTKEEVPRKAGGNGYMNLGSQTALPAKGGAPAPKPVEVIPTTATRKWWVRFVWLCTWWIPSFLLKWVGRMKRADVQMAWREKVTICLLIFGMCGLVIFTVIFFGRLLCPEFNFAWSPDDLLAHTRENDFWISVRGEAYDITSFWRGDHSVAGAPMTPDVTITFAGTDMSNYFPPPLEIACADLVTSDRMELRYANATSAPNPRQAVHKSGALVEYAGTRLTDSSWYGSRFLPRMKEFHKGPIVFPRKKISGMVNEDSRVLGIYYGEIFDISDYLQTLTDNNGGGGYDFLDADITAQFKQQPGQDISKSLDRIYSAMDPNRASATKICLKNVFYIGRTDFRETARCLAPNYVILAFSVLIATTILAKFFAALQLTSKRQPELLDKFIICQVPCYTEGEESLRRTIDSLAALKYDDKRKLLFLICDGNIVGSGNDRPTPRIVLDILGVDPGLDPEPLMFKSIGEGSKQLNYGKVYSGLYEFEGHVVPYMVVVKVGKPSERQRPGNRGKRDSQILLLHYLNRVHFDAPMYPLELEIYHQMRNVIGIDPAFYEYIFMVDADTTVEPDSLNRLVAVTSDDSAVIAVCGETKLDNEEGSWWTMIQVYEYYISHHLAKAFESLFGSVTCLPGCFSMYRIRTADKGRPLIISNRIIDEYSECNVDTLHKKNLLSLGEDRYLTTLMMKHFPTFKMKFTPDAIAHTIAPDQWSVLLSQRRRWINSTIHNLCELVGLGELCGFCCFSMRFIVFIDLLGTIILPATAVYLVYLIVTVSIGRAPIPIIALAMLGAVYGLQAIIFLLKREFMLIGWMVIYIAAYPVYSFFLPIYSFWRMDDFSWGNTRIVVGEGKDKKVILQDDEGFDDSMIPLKKFSEYEAEALDYVSQHSGSRSPSRPPSRPQSRTQSRHHGSQAHLPPPSQSIHGGDYYRDTNLTHNSSSNPNLKMPNPRSVGGHSGQGSFHALPQMNFGGSHAGSDYGHGPMPGYASSEHAMFATPFGVPPGSNYAGSMYGAGGMAAPRNSVMTNLNMFGGSGAVSAPFMGGGARPMSTFSMATTMNPFAGAPSQNTDPTDEELLQVLRVYLSTQDLMSVTKKTAREAVTARFPKADLSSRKEFLNQSIDRILSET